MNSESKKKSTKTDASPHDIREDYSLNNDFEYKHKNPYHEKLAEFGNLVLRDSEGEENRGLWNKNIFKNNNAIHMEIGSGYGHFLTDLCQKKPDANVIGLDYRFKRSFNLMSKISKENITNLRYLRAKGERIGQLFGENELDYLYYFFPDPWPKKRHRKKRLFNAQFLEMAHKTLKKDGIFYIKTDHDDYFEWMCEAYESKKNLFTLELQTRDIYKEFPTHYLTTFQTKFEKIFLAKEIKIKAMVLKIVKES